MLNSIGDSPLSPALSHKGRGRKYKIIVTILDQIFCELYRYRNLAREAIFLHPAERSWET